MVKFTNWLDPVFWLQFWLFIGMNIVCLCIVVKLFKLLLYVASQEVLDDDVDYNIIVWYYVIYAKHTNDHGYL